jgi:hypothetical protein
MLAPSRAAKLSPFMSTCSTSATWSPRVSVGRRSPFSSSQRTRLVFHHRSTMSGLPSPSMSRRTTRSEGGAVSSERRRSEAGWPLAGPAASTRSSVTRAQATALKTEGAPMAEAAKKLDLTSHKTHFAQHGSRRGRACGGADLSAYRRAGPDRKGLGLNAPGGQCVNFCLRAWRESAHRRFVPARSAK